MQGSGALPSGRACTMWGGDVASWRGRWGQRRVLTGDHTGGVTEWGLRSLQVSRTGSWGRMGCTAEEDRGGVAPRGTQCLSPLHLLKKPAPFTELHSHVAQDLQKLEGGGPRG